MKAFLAARFGSQHLIEFRAIRAGDIRRFWVRLAGVPAIEPELHQLNANGWDIYVGVNPRSSARSDERSVSELVCFHADIDFSKGRGPTKHSDCYAIVKTLDEKTKPNHAAAQACQSGFDSEGPFGAKPRMEAVDARNFPEPTIIVDSGHGRHLYWLLKTPVTVSDANRERLRGINRGLAAASGGDSVCDLGRILRVPDFKNHKPPVADVILLSSSGPRYELEIFDPFVMPASAPLSTIETELCLPETAAALTPELTERFKAVRRKNSEISRAWRGEIGDGSSDSRYVLVRKLGGCGFTHSEITSIVTSRRWLNKRTKKFRPAQEVLRDAQRLTRHL